MRIILSHYAAFTFHYGPIQMNETAREAVGKAYLHSTMVLFKLDVVFSPFFEALFTFHYGPIQMLIEPSIEID